MRFFLALERSGAGRPLPEQSNQVRTPLGRTGRNQPVARSCLTYPQQGPLAGLARCFDAKVRSLLGPWVRKIGMGPRLGLIAKKQHDVAGCGLLRQKLQPQSAALEGVFVLACFERVARALSSKAPLLRSTWERCVGEMDTPLWRWTSAARRPQVQGMPACTGVASTFCATARAAWPWVGGRPVCGRASRASVLPPGHLCCLS